MVLLMIIPAIMGQQQHQHQQRRRLHSVESSNGHHMLKVVDPTASKENQVVGSMHIKDGHIYHLNVEGKQHIMNGRKVTNPTMQGQY